jgi:hypothetical protein
MKTLFDFMTYIKGVEYLVALSAIAVYLIYWEFLKPKPFKSLAETAREDISYLSQNGYREAIKTVGKIIAAPFVGLSYIVALPFAFMYALGTAALSGILTLTGKEAAFGWRPTEAYLGGKKKAKKESEKKEDEK